VLQEVRGHGAQQRVQWRPIHCSGWYRVIAFFHGGAVWAIIAVAQILSGFFWPGKGYFSPMKGYHEQKQQK
jgi:hypothetical protein